MSDEPDNYNQYQQQPEPKDLIINYQDGTKDKLWNINQGRGIQLNSNGCLIKHPEGCSCQGDSVIGCGVKNFQIITQKPKTQV